MKYKLLALDIDGTLLNSERKLTARTESAIKQAIRSGVMVTLCTGRPIQGVRKYIDALGLTAPIITYNGAEIVDPVENKTLFCERLGYADALKIIEMGKKEGFTMCIWSEGALYGLPLDDLVRDYQKISGVEALEANDPEALAIQGITKIIWYSTPERVSEWMLKLKDEEFESVNFSTSNPAFLELFSGKVSKRIAMQRLAEALSVSAEQTVAVGDGLNDIPMLEFAGLGIAMGNASSEVKAIADEVVGDNDSDGVATAIERFIL